MTGCRIGTVRYKNSPHLLEIMPRKRGEEIAQTLKVHAEKLAQNIDDMAGFAVVAWGFDGRFSRGYRIHNDSFIGKTLMPSFVADVLRRDTMADVASEIVRGEYD